MRSWAVAAALFVCGVLGGAAARLGLPARGFADGAECVAGFRLDDEAPGAKAATGSMRAVEGLNAASLPKFIVSGQPQEPDFSQVPEEDVLFDSKIGLAINEFMNAGMDDPVRRAASRSCIDRFVVPTDDIAPGEKFTLRGYAVVTVVPLRKGAVRISSAVAGAREWADLVDCMIHERGWPWVGGVVEFDPNRTGEDSLPEPIQFKLRFTYTTRRPA